MSKNASLMTFVNEKISEKLKRSKGVLKTESNSSGNVHKFMLEMSDDLYEKTLLQYYTKNKKTIKKAMSYYKKNNIDNKLAEIEQEVNESLNFENIKGELSDDGYIKFMNDKSNILKEKENFLNNVEQNISILFKFVAEFKSGGWLKKFMAFEPAPFPSPPTLSSLLLPESSVQFSSENLFDVGKNKLQLGDLTNDFNEVFAVFETAYNYIIDFIIFVDEQKKAYEEKMDLIRERIENINNNVATKQFNNDLIGIYVENIKTLEIFGNEKFNEKDLNANIATFRAKFPNLTYLKNSIKTQYVRYDDDVVDKFDKLYSFKKKR